MGLLQRASSKTEIVPDDVPKNHRGFLERAAAIRSSAEIERLCIDRIARLTVGSDSAQTILSVLRAMYPCRALFLLASTAEGYSVTAAIGLESKDRPKVDIDLSKLEDEQHRKGFFVLPSDQFPVVTESTDGLVHIFPLPESSSAPALVLCVLLDNLYETFANSLRRVLNECGPKLLPKRQQVVLADDAFLTSMIEKIGLPAQLMVLDGPGLGSRAEEAGVRLGALGAARAWGEARLVLAIKNELDRGLIAHQIVKSLKLTNDAARIIGDITVREQNEASSFLRTLT